MRNETALQNNKCNRKDKVKHSSRSNAKLVIYIMLLAMLVFCIETKANFLS